MSRARIEKIASRKRREAERKAKGAISLAVFAPEPEVAAEFDRIELIAMADVYKARKVFGLATPATFGAPEFRKV
jgi:hypothetical protein